MLKFPMVPRADCEARLSFNDYVNGMISNFLKLINVLQAKTSALYLAVLQKTTLIVTEIFREK